MLFAALLIASCGSERNTTVADRRSGTNDLIPLGMPSLASDTLGLAVVDSSHALVVESRSGVLLAAGLVEARGGLGALADGLPPLGKVHVVGMADGYVIVGIRCAGGAPLQTETGDDQQLCTPDLDSDEIGLAEPVALGLNTAGNVIWTSVGPKVDPSRFGGVAPTQTGAMLQLDGGWFLVDDGGFHAVDPPKPGHDEFTPCVLRDGRVAAFVADYSSIADDAGGGRRQAMVREKGEWVPVGAPVDVAAGGLVTSSCTNGGLISRTQLFVSDAPVPAQLDDVGLESVAGITADGLVLIDTAPRRLIDPKSGSSTTPLPDADYVTLSQDGRTIAEMNDQGVSLRAAT